LAGGATPSGSSERYLEFAAAGITALMMVARWSARIVPGGGAATPGDGAAAISEPIATAAVVNVLKRSIVLLLGRKS
jgi:hypothetical protein